MIDLNDVSPGDILTVQDAIRNVMVAPVSYVEGVMHVEAFQTYISVARVNRNGRWVPLQGIKIVGHQPRLAGEGMW